MNVFIQTDPAEAIDGSVLDPHYTDHRFDRDAQTVFLLPGNPLKRSYGTETVEGLSYDYSDRISGWFPTADREAAWKKAKAKYPETKSALFIQEYLRILYKDETLELVHILAGVNRSNGYPYRVYGYRRAGSEKPE